MAMLSPIYLCMAILYFTCFGMLWLSAKAVEGTTTVTTTTAASGWLFSGGGGSSNAAKPKATEESADGTNIGLNVKTPFFLGGVSSSYLLPADLLNITGFTGCITEVQVGSRSLDLIGDAERYANVSSCPDKSVMNDDPCLKLPCGSHGQCTAISSGDFSCTCESDYIGRLCDEKKTACSGDHPCKNNGICEPIGSDGFKCRCIVGWTGDTCETRDTSDGIAYAQGSEDSIVVPQLDADDFAIGSNFLIKNQSSGGNGGGRSPTGRRRFNDATRHRDFFKIWRERRKGARDKTIASGKKACFGGGGYLELPRQLLPTGSPEMRVQLTISTRSKEGVIYWQGQQMDISGAGKDFFGIGLSDGFVKFSFELGGGPAVLKSSVRINDGSSHVIVAQRQGQNGTLQIDELSKVTASSGGPHKQLNGNGNIYLGGVPHYKRMVSNIYKPGFNGCLSHMKLSSTNGAIDLFKQKLSGVDVTDE